MKFGGKGVCAGRKEGMYVGNIAFCKKKNYFN